MSREIALTFDDILLIPQYNDISSRRDVDLSVTDKSGKLTLNLPIFSSNMDTITESSMSSFIRSYGGMGVLHRFMLIERNIEEFNKFQDCFVSIGANLNEYERFLALYDAGARKFCVDVAHGHSWLVLEMCRNIKKYDPNITLMAGNVVTARATTMLAEAGADIVKVGIGGGSVCSTRIKTGFGVPQLTAIERCSQNSAGVSIVADGGIRTPGDIVKALAFGADFVMLGGMLAGTHPTPGEIIYPEGEKVCPMKSYRGMASLEVASEQFGGLPDWKTAEGVATTVPWKDGHSVIKDIIGGLRSGLTYSGAQNIQQLQNKLDYCIVSNNGLIESRPHKLD